MKRANWLATLLLVVLLVWLLRHLQWPALLAYATRASLPWFSALIALQLIVLFLWATLWRSQLPHNQPASFVRLLESVALTGAAMLVAPSVTGQLSAVGILARRAQLRVSVAAMLIASEQVCEAAAKVVVLLAALSFAPLSPQARAATRIVALVFALAIGLVIIASRSWRRTRFLFRDSPALARGITIALTIKLVEAGALLAAQHSLGVTLGLGAVLLLLAVAAVGIVAASVLPVPGPVGIGEAVMVAGYTQLGLSLELSVALVGVHAAALVLTRVGAAAVAVAAGPALVRQAQ